MKLSVGEVLQLFKELSDNKGILTAKLSIGTKAEMLKLAEELLLYVKIFEENQDSLIKKLGVNVNDEGFLTDNTPDIEEIFKIENNKLSEETVEINIDKYLFDIDKIKSIELESIPTLFIKIFINGSFQDRK